MAQFRKERDSLGEVNVPKERLWGAETERALAHFSIGDELMPAEMVDAYAIVKKAAALVNHRDGRLSARKRDLIVKACEEILKGMHREEFPLHVWMSGSGTQFNMNVNEVISNRCSQLAQERLGSKKPVHPHDDVNLSQSTNDSFPAAMHIAAAVAAKKDVIPALEQSLSLRFARQKR